MKKNRHLEACLNDYKKMLQNDKKKHRSEKKSKKKTNSQISKSREANYILNWHPT